MLLVTWLKAAFRWVRIGVYLSIDSIAALITFRRQGSDALVIRLDAIGDFVIWLQCGAADLVTELRREHSRVVLVANPLWADLAVSLNLWDEVVVLDGQRFARSMLYRFIQIRKLRRLKYRTVVQPRAARLFLVDDALVRASGAQDRIGSDAVMANTSTLLKWVGNRFYTRIIDVPLSLTIHESARGSAFALAYCRNVGRRVGVPVRKKTPPFIDGLGASGYVVIAPGAGWDGRQWPVGNFASIVDYIHVQSDLQCVLIGTMAEKGLSVKIIEICSTRVVDLVGMLSISECVDLIGGARYLVCNESGPLHIGVWCGVDVVSIVGGGHFGWFSPYPANFPSTSQIKCVHFKMDCFGCNWRCRYEPVDGLAVRCISGIKVDDVISAICCLKSAA